MDAQIIIFIIPFITFAISIIASKKLIVSLITTIPNMVLLGIATYLNKCDLHSSVAKMITSMNFNLFNIATVIFLFIMTILIYKFTKKQTENESRTIINMTIFILTFLIELILIKIYYSCQ